MTHSNADTTELICTTIVNKVLTSAAQEADGLNDASVDTAHILLVLASLTSDYAVYRPLRELGFDYDELLLQMAEYSRMGSFAFQRRMSPVYDEAIQDAARLASLRGGDKIRIIGLIDLTIAVFASTSPLVLDLLKQRGITQYMAMTTMEAPDEFILRFIDVPAE